MSHAGFEALNNLVEESEGVAGVAGYLQVDPEVIELAVNAPRDGGGDRVANMVAENTRKLVLMPSQDGFFWRLTRKRVVKDWVILAKLGLGGLPAVSADDDPDAAADRVALAMKVRNQR